MFLKPSLGSPRQQGFGVIAAVVVLVMLSALAAYMVSITTAQHVGVAMDLLGGRALQAARSGMDWGVSRVVTAPATFGGVSCTPTSAPATAPVSVHLTSADLAAYPGMTVTVTCAATEVTDGAALISYALTATACNQPSSNACPNTVAPNAEYVERRITTQVVCNATGPC